MTSRKRRQELRRLVEEAAAYADRKLVEAIREGWIDASDLPRDAQQRVAILEGRALEARIVEGDRIEIEAEGQSNTKHE